MSGARGYLVVSLCVVALVYLLHRALRPNVSKRNVQVFTEMVYSRAYESCSPSPDLPGGATQQPLVPGVVPRGATPFRYGPGEEQALLAAQELASPFISQDPTALSRGKELYGIYCVACHGHDGHGRGPVTARGMPCAPSLHGARALEIPDGELFHLLTHGRGDMSSYALQLSQEERWKVILHVRALQREGGP